MPTYSTRFNNKKVASLGNVTITFDDGTAVTKDIQACGSYYFDKNSSRQPIQVDALGQSWQIADITAAGASGASITYPGDEGVGTFTMTTNQDASGNTECTIHWDDLNWWGW